jgi:dTDP-4-dehydrorhamnose 3,5-epimerase-like enzyme
MGFMEAFAQHSAEFHRCCSRISRVPHFVSRKHLVRGAHDDADPVDSMGDEGYEAFECSR